MIPFLVHASLRLKFRFTITLSPTSKSSDPIIVRDRDRESRDLKVSLSREGEASLLDEYPDREVSLLDLDVGLSYLDGYRHRDVSLIDDCDDRSEKSVSVCLLDDQS